MDGGTQVSAQPEQQEVATPGSQEPAAADAPSMEAGETHPPAETLGAHEPAASGEDAAMAVQASRASEDLGHVNDQPAAPSFDYNATISKIDQIPVGDV